MTETVDQAQAQPPPARAGVTFCDAALLRSADAA